RKFRDAVLETFTHVAEGQLGTLLVAGLGNAVGNGSVGQNAGDQQFLAGKKTHVSVSRKIPAELSHVYPDRLSAANDLTVRRRLAGRRAVARSPRCPWVRHVGTTQIPRQLCAFRLR